MAAQGRARPAGAAASQGKDKSGEVNSAAAKAAAMSTAAEPIEVTRPKVVRRPKTSAGLLPLPVHFKLTPGILVADKRDRRLSITCGCKTCVGAVTEEDKRMEPPEWLRHCGATAAQMGWKETIKVDGALSSRGKPLSLESWAKANSSEFVYTNSGAGRGTRLVRTAASKLQRQQVSVDPQLTKGSGSGAGVPEDGAKAKKSAGRKKLHAATVPTGATAPQEAAAAMVWSLESPLGEAGSLPTSPGAVLTMRVVPGSIVRRRDSGQLGWVQYILPNQVEAADVGASLANLQVVPVVRGRDMPLGDAASPDQLFLLDTRPAPRQELLGGAAAGAGGGGGTGGYADRAPPSNAKVGEATAPQGFAALRPRDSGEVWALEEVVAVLQVDVQDIIDRRSTGGAESHTGSPPAVPAASSSSAPASEDDRTPLHIACESGDAVSVEGLLAAGADTTARTKDGFTALTVASENGHTAVVEALLAAGAYKDMKEEASGHTALHIASGSGRTAVVEALLAAGADMEARTKAGATALIIAIQNGHTAVVEALLAAGANVEVMDKAGFTVLMIASRNGNTAVVKALLAAGADVGAKDVEGSTALHIACCNSHTAVVAALVAAGADVTAADKNGVTPIRIARAIAHTAVEEALRAPRAVQEVPRGAQAAKLEPMLEHSKPLHHLEVPEPMKLYVGATR
ncbi:Ankyrin repeat domain-containing protein 6 [Tetrabaena socialis]|uniref:Ankyrin repeat domain-containing protein 6 n=1 Tax=Tetrabaena socialis TaxID=47790 RepID=A0A2J8A5Y3_9CHLO|nr:Ankyrin repeat domain-containing protein 6 [Tetrabaena socialis]|eukprot:PNH07910.1 Ankyrin repeat domain-containing protein 6 [Tetrabaena socialis]